MEKMKGGRTGGQLSRLEVSIYLALVLASVLPYIGAIRHLYFLADDFAELFLVKDLRLPDLFTVGFYHKFGNFGFIRPVGLLLWKANYLLYGFEPVGYHVTNLLLHTVCVLLVFLIASSLTRDLKAGLAAGFIFAVHPVHVEAVDWLSCRYDLASTAFYLSGLILYMRYSSIHDGRWKYYFGAMLAMSLAVLSKEMALTFPLALVMYELFYHKGNGRGLKGVLLWTSPFFALAAGYFKLRFIVFHGIGGYGSRLGGAWLTREPSLPDILHRLSNYIQALFFGLAENQPYHPLVMGFLIFAAVSAGFLILPLAQAGRKKVVLFSAALMFMTFLPFINFSIITENYMSNARFLYLPSAFFSILISAAVTTGRSAGRFVKVVSVLSLTLILCCNALLVRNYNKTWTGESGRTSSILNQFKEIYPGPLDGLDVMVYNLPLEVFGVNEYVPMSFARALYFMYGCPSEKKFVVKTKNYKPGDKLQFDLKPDDGLRRKLVLFYSPENERLIVLFDSRRETRPPPGIK